MSEPGDGTGPEGPEEVGSVADEAAKLFGALSDWARDHGSDLGQGLSGLAAQAATSAREVNDHVATGGAECTYCPICRTVHLVRQTSPEVRDPPGRGGRVAHAGGGRGARRRRAGRAPRRRGRGDGVEHIDLDGRRPWPEDDA